MRAWTVVANSGREVPRPMIVAPTIEVGKTINPETFTELSTVNFERTMTSLITTKNLVPT